MHVYIFDKFRNICTIIISFPFQLIRLMKTQRLFLITLLFLLWLPASISAQEFLPFLNSNYAGVNGVILQPASIADSRYKVDVCLLGLGASFYNNYASMDRYMFFNSGKLKGVRIIDAGYVAFNDNSDLKSIYMNSDIHTMSFMINLSDKDAFAITPRTRFAINADNITPTLAKLIYEGLNYPDSWLKRLDNANLSLQMNSWFELDAAYGRVLLDDQKHFLKAGATVKVLQGLGSGYLYAKDLSYQFDDTSTLSLFQSDIKYGISDNFNLDKDNSNYNFATDLSLGFDVGFVYEYRPNFEKYRFEMDGKTGLWRKDLDKYFIRAGISLLDVGRVRYKKSSASQDFNADIRDWDLSKLEINSIQDFNDTLRNRFIFASKDEPQFFMNLPTAISAQIDLNLSHGFFVNFSPYIALNKGTKDQNKIHALTSYTFTPRYDGRTLGFFLPLQLNSYKQFNAGVGVHLGQFWVGSNDIISFMLANGFQYGGSAYMMLKVPIFNKKIKDRDGDKVSDSKDLCKEVPGLWAFKGCPDTDGDSIQDAKDHCPEIPGIKAMNGCPDADGDGITDADDACPDTKGLLEFDGCPDSDGDSIIDSQDECPFQAGLAVFHGCPDTDGDGVPDKNDLCPTVSGNPESKGCPFIDTDGDGVKDSEDACPNEAGLIENKGCPLADSDGDKIPDIYDKCPTIPGVAENNGCPEIKKEEQEVLNTAFSSLEFETGKSVIKKASFASLDKLAELLKMKTNWNLQLSGHTDNVGKPVSNMALSKNRTLAVKKYLVKKGVPDGRIKPEWYGQTRPTVPNTTPEGRQKNRRVEIAIFF